MPAPSEAQMLVSDLDALVKNDRLKVEKVSLSEVKFQADGMKVFKEKYIPTPQAIDGIAKVFEAPGKFIREMPADMSANVLNWLKDSSEHDTIQLGFNRDKLTNVWHGNDHIIPKKSFAKVLLETLPGEAEIHRFEYTNDNVYFEVSSPTNIIEPHKGDVTQGGLLVRGAVAPRNHSPEIRPFTHRLWCANGHYNVEMGELISVKGQTVPEIIDSMRENCKRIWDEDVSSLLEQTAHMTEIEVDNPSAFVHTYAVENKLGVKLERAILAELPSLEVPVTEYDLMQLITKYQHRTTSPIQRDAIMRIGGKMIADSQHRHRCNQCAQLLPAGAPVE